MISYSSTMLLIIIYHGIELNSPRQPSSNELSLIDHFSIQTFLNIDIYSWLYPLLTNRPSISLYEMVYTYIVDYIKIYMLIYTYIVVYIWWPPYIYMVVYIYGGLYIWWSIYILWSIYGNHHIYIYIWWSIYIYGDLYIYYCLYMVTTIYIYCGLYIYGDLYIYWGLYMVVYIYGGTTVLPILFILLVKIVLSIAYSSVDIHKVIDS